MANVSAATLAAERAGDLCVVIHDLESQRVFDGPPESLDRPNVRHVVLTRGRSRAIRDKAPWVVSVDVSVLRGRRVIRAVAVAAGRTSPEVYLEHETDAHPTSVREAARPRLSVEEARRTGRLILVAEDDRTNQRVILQQLQLLGHTAEIAERGVEALAMWRAAGRYALLLRLTA